MSRAPGRPESELPEYSLLWVHPLPRERFSDLLTMIDGKSMATLSYVYLWVFDLRARLRAQQSSLLMRLESCVT